MDLQTVSLRISRGRTITLLTRTRRITLPSCPIRRRGKYREATKGRTDQAELKRRTEERLKQAKMRSFCGACKRCGHWHKDPECPWRGRSGEQQKGEGESKIQQAHLCIRVYVCSSELRDEDDFLKVPTDTLVEPGADCEGLQPRRSVWRAPWPTQSPTPWKLPWLSLGIVPRSTPSPTTPRSPTRRKS